MREDLPWHQDDEFWSELAPFMFGQEAWDAAPDEVSRVLALMQLAPPAAVLDLGCGPGRHSLELARLGFRVTGVDRTTLYLDEARSRVKQEELSVEFIQEDMRRFLRPDTFQGALSVFTSFGYFDRHSDNQQVLLNVYRSLKAGGVFLIDIVGREILARIFQPRDWREVNGILLLEDRRVERNWTIMNNHRILIKDGEQIKFTVKHWIYSANQLAHMLAESGFDQVEIFGDFGGTPYDHNARRLVAVARK